MVVDAMLAPLLRDLRCRVGRWGTNTQVMVSTIAYTPVDVPVQRIHQEHENHVMIWTIIRSVYPRSSYVRCMRITPIGKQYRSVSYMLSKLACKVPIRERAYKLRGFTLELSSLHASYLNDKGIMVVNQIGATIMQTVRT